MSVVFEHRTMFHHDGNYPPIGEAHDLPDVVADVHVGHDVGGVHDVHHDVHDVHDVPPETHDVHTDHQVHGTHEVHQAHDPHDVQADDASRFDDTDVAELAAAVGSYSAPTPVMIEPEPSLQIVDGLPDDVPALPKPESPSAVNGNQRIKAIPKPDREPTKNLTGKFVCTWPDCQEEVREFNRKCEWNKHMDKHDRPYKCLAEGCEKLAGFTYSGGLLRHEREVHAKHGGPKNPLNCPHQTCKRHTGKGFSRQENLNEHLRRCHRNGSPSNAGGDTDDGASETAPGAVGGGSGGKRKRDTDEDVAELRAEVKKHRLENEELRQQLEAQNRQIAAMMQQLSELQQARDQQQLSELQPASDLLQ